jgi:DnaJ-class molecular chaperone
MKSLAPLLAVIVLAVGGYKVYGMYNEIKALKEEVADLNRENRELSSKNNELQSQVTQLQQELEEAKKNNMGMGSPFGAGQQQSATPAGMTEINCPNCSGRGLISFTGMDGRTRQGPCPVCGGAGKKMLRIPEGNVVCPNCNGMQFIPKEVGSSSRNPAGSGGGGGSSSFSRSSGVGSRELCPLCSGRGYIKGTPGQENDPYGGGGGYGGMGMGGGMGGQYR